MRLPAATDANPHCGLSASRSSATNYHVQARVLLQADGRLDRGVLDPLELRRGQPARGVPAPGLDELRRPQQAVIGRYGARSSVMPG
jgi:hypothetical protein